jgi:hypothetical protein
MENETSIIPDPDTAAFLIKTTKALVVMKAICLASLRRDGASDN